MSQKKDRRVIQSEEAIIEAGIKTLLINPSAGMSEIAEAAGIGRATLYRHFESREALIRALTLRCYGEIEAALNPYDHLLGRAAIEKIIDVLMPIANRFRFLGGLWTYVEGDEEVRRIESQVNQEMRLLFDHAKLIGDIDDSLPTPWLTSFFDSTLMAGWMMVESNDASPEDAATFVKQSFFNGCGKRDLSKVSHAR